MTVYYNDPAAIVRKSRQSSGGVLRHGALRFRERLWGGFFFEINNAIPNEVKRSSRAPTSNLILSTYLGTLAHSHHSNPGEEVPHAIAFQPQLQKKATLCVYIGLLERILSASAPNAFRPSQLNPRGLDVPLGNSSLLYRHWEVSIYRSSSVGCDPSCSALVFVNPHSRTTSIRVPANILHQTAQHPGPDSGCDLHTL